MRGSVGPARRSSLGAATHSSVDRFVRGVRICSVRRADTGSRTVRKKLLQARAVLSFRRRTLVTEESVHNRPGRADGAWYSFFRTQSPSRGTLPSFYHAGDGILARLLRRECQDVWKAQLCSGLRCHPCSNRTPAKNAVERVHGTCEVGLYRKQWCSYQPNTHTHTHTRQRGHRALGGFAFL